MFEISNNKPPKKPINIYNKNKEDPGDFEKILSNKFIVKELSKKPVSIKLAVIDRKIKVYYKEENKEVWEEIGLKEKLDERKIYKSEKVKALHLYFSEPDPENEKFFKIANPQYTIRIGIGGEVDYSYDTEKQKFINEFDGVKDSIWYDLNYTPHNDKLNFDNKSGVEFNLLHLGMSDATKQYIKFLNEFDNNKYGFDVYPRTDISGNRYAKSMEGDWYTTSGNYILANDIDNNGQYDSITMDINDKLIITYNNYNKYYSDNVSSFSDLKISKNDMYNENATILERLKKADNENYWKEVKLLPERKLNSKQYVQITEIRDINDHTEEVRISTTYKTSQIHNLGYQPVYSFSQAYNYLSDCVKARGGKPLEQITISTHGVYQYELYKHVKLLMDNGILAKGGTLISDSCNNAGSDPEFTPKENRDTETVAMQKWNTCKMIAQKFGIDFYASTATETTDDGFLKLYHFYPDGREPTLDNKPYDDER